MEPREPDGKLIDFSDAALQIGGVWAVARGADWRAALDADEEGALRSLAAFVLSIPFALIIAITAAKVAAASPEFARSVFAGASLPVIVAVQFVKFVIYWGASLVGLFLFARRIRADAQALGLVVAYNWAQFLAIMVTTAPGVLFLATGAPEAFSLLVLPATVFSVFLLWRVLRATLSTTIGATIAVLAALIALELAIGSLVGAVAASLSGLLT